MAFALQTSHLLGMRFTARRQGNTATRRHDAVPRQTQRRWRLRERTGYPACPSGQPGTGGNTAVRCHLTVRHGGNGGVDALQGFHGPQSTAPAGYISSVAANR